MLADNKEGGNKKGKELEKEGLDRVLAESAEDIGRQVWIEGVGGPGGQS